MSNVNHPEHYNMGGIEVIDAIEAWGLGFCLGNAVKYIARAGRKDPDKMVQDLEKADWYLRRVIERWKNTPKTVDSEKEDDTQGMGELGKKLDEWCGKTHCAECPINPDHTKYAGCKLFRQMNRSEMQEALYKFEEQHTAKERNMREEMYGWCNQVQCMKCPLNDKHDGSSAHCPNFLSLEGKELTETYEKMKGAAKNAKQEE